MAISRTDQCIVLPFRAENQQTADGRGLALHFLVGNVLVLHTGLKEMWFGWRVKKIFPEKAAFQRYCLDAAMKLDLVRISRSQKVRFWIYGNYTDTSVSLHFFDGKRPEATHPPVDLAITLDDNLIGFRTQFIDWLQSLGRPMTNDQANAALWPETINRQGLNAVGEALADFYMYSAYGGNGPLNVSPFKKAAAAAPGSFMAQDLLGWARYRNQDYKAARGAFLTSLSINPAGAGAMSGMMWCGVYSKDLEETMFWSGRKADVCRQDVLAAREAGRRRYAKVNNP